MPFPISLKLILLGSLALAATAGNLNFLTSPSAPADTVTWNSLGSDGTTFSDGAASTSSNGSQATIHLDPTLGGLVSVVCAPTSPTNCSWGSQPTGYTTGEYLIWAEGLDTNSNPVGSGPVTIALRNAVGGIGTYLQTAAAGAFQATLALYNGAALLGSQSYSSNNAGDPLFVGARDSAVEINKAVLTVTQCGSFACDANDFSVGKVDLYDQLVSSQATPEPSTAILFGGVLLAAWSRRNHLRVASGRRVPAVLAALLLCAAIPAQKAMAQSEEPTIDPSILKEIHVEARSTASGGTFSGGTTTGSGTTAAALPIWQYSVVSPRNGATYTGSVVGGNPFNRGARTTTVKIVLIPLRLSLTGTVRNFDPTSPDNGCLGSGFTAMNLTQNSPLFNTVPNLTMNGVNLGTVTYPDAFQRASFWSTVAAVSPAYHLAFSVSLAPVQTITTANSSTGNAASYTFTGDCGSNSTSVANPGTKYAFANINWVDGQLQSIIRSLGITADEFPLFVTYRTYMTTSAPGNLSGNCCILGYHNSYTGNTASPGQTYGIAGYDTGRVFSNTNDLSVLTHEFMEWVNDPSGNNLVPEWGNIGQVGGCVVTGNTHTAGQDNLEVGDPLSGHLNPSISMPNGKTYHPQEQAFFSWFLGTTAGAGGKYSSNGTFGGYARSCAAGGGTN